MEIPQSWEGEETNWKQQRTNNIIWTEWCKVHFTLCSANFSFLKGTFHFLSSEMCQLYKSTHKTDTHIVDVYKAYIIIDWTI